MRANFVGIDSLMQLPLWIELENVVDTVKVKTLQEAPSSLELN